VATDKRQRQKQGRQARLEAERSAAARSRRIKGIRNAVIFAIIVVIVAFVLSTRNHKDKSESVKTDRTTTTTTTTQPTLKPAKASVCPPADGSAKRTVSFTGALKNCLKSGHTYTAAVTTSQGRFDVLLDTARTPKTANAFVVLSRWKYYDGTKLFRAEKDSGIIQGGSPHTQDSTDPGPGFVILDEGGTFTSADYGPGALAMARTAKPDSADGQFFLLSGEGARYLGDKKGQGKSAGTYVVFGRVTRGLDVLKRLSALDDGQQKPSTPVSVTKVQISET
jgi:cyclophilin family peptidyl-prolyl cis-trans isomerase